MSELEGLKLLRRIEEGVAGKSGDAFFKQIVRDLTLALGGHAAFTSRLLPERRAVMLAFWVDGRYEKCLEYALAGTPCEFVYNGKITAFARDIGNVFPIDKAWFEELGVNSYLGIPIVSETGEVHGHIAVMDRPERDWLEADVDVLRLFSLRTAVELERMKAQRMLEATNEQLRAEIAQRRAVESQLAAAKLAAESANQAKSMFISQMSHELRTPLNGILGYAQLLKRNSTGLTERQLDGLDIVERSGEHLLNLVNDLLDLAKIEAGKLELRDADVDLADLLRHVSDLIGVRADKAGQQFCATLPDDLPQSVRTDARALRQILLNLLGNAVKFTPAGGRIELGVAATTPSNVNERLLRFEIRDSGIGIPAAELAQIFEPFHRVVDHARTVEGTGLGLAITHRLVEALQASIDVTSTVGVGTTFVVEMPVHLTDKQARAAARSHSVSGYDGPQRSVLVVDDDDVNSELVATLLQSLGFSVQRASDGQQALELIGAMVPDLLVTDLVMPRVDGIELTRALRCRPGMDLPIIALSASASDYTGREALDAGCNDFLTKPVHLDLLIDRIGALLGLEWRQRADLGTNTNAVDTTVEPTVIDRAQLDELYHLAMLGDVQGLMERARQLLAWSDDRQSLLRQLNALAEQYDTNGLRRVLSAQREHVSRLG